MTRARFVRLVALPLLCAATVTVVVALDPPSRAPGAEIAAAGAAGAPSGRALYVQSCAGCHGVELAGVAGFGPPLLAEGGAATDYVLRTGRMPLADPTVLPSRNEVQFDDAEIRALVDYVASVGSGPDVPVVDTAGADVVAGGRLFRLNCAACHVASGAGAVIGGDREAPSLSAATATQVAEAIAVGPGAMPVLSAGFTERDVADIAAYVEDLQAQRASGRGALGGVGPVAEGLAAWALGLLPLVAITRWIGGPREAGTRSRAAKDGGTT